MNILLFNERSQCFQSLLPIKMLEERLIKECLYIINVCGKLAVSRCLILLNSVDLALQQRTSYRKIFYF